MTSVPQSSVPSTRSVDELWLDVFQQITARTAHELKGALNGVAVNLEVVRSRSAKSDASAVSLAPFASSAADQLDAVVGMSEALLALARAPREPIDIGETIDSLASLLAPLARAEGGSLRIESAPRDVTANVARARGNSVRLIIGATLLAALSRKGDIRCRVEGDGTEEISMSIECADAEGPLELPAELLVAAGDAGIRVHGEGQNISLIFPRAGAARKRTHERA